MESLKLTREEIKALVEALEIGVPEVFEAAEYAEEPSHKDDLFSKAILAKQIEEDLRDFLKDSVDSKKGIYFI